MGLPHMFIFTCQLTRGELAMKVGRIVRGGGGGFAALTLGTEEKTKPLTSDS